MGPIIRFCFVTNLVAFSLTFILYYLASLCIFFLTYWHYYLFTFLLFIIYIHIFILPHFFLLFSFLFLFFPFSLLLSLLLLLLLLSFDAPTFWRKISIFKEVYLLALETHTFSYFSFKSNWRNRRNTTFFRRIPSSYGFLSLRLHYKKSR